MAKLLPDNGPVFFMSEYFNNYDMHSLTSLHILFVQIFIKYQRNAQTTHLSKKSAAKDIYMDTALFIL